MKASILDTLLIIWGGYSGTTYQHFYITYYNNLLELRRAWLLQYSPFPNVRHMMPQELEDVPRWAFFYTVVHLILATVLLLVIAAIASFIATSYFRVSFQYSAQFNSLMIISAVIWMALADPGSKHEFIHSFAQFLCADTHLQKDINEAHHNVAMRDIRERIDRQKFSK